MYDPQTDASLACFDPNHLPLSATLTNILNNNINGTNIQQNGYSLDPNNINNSDNNNKNFQSVIDSNSMALDFQNPNINNNDDNNNNNRNNNNDINNWSNTNNIHNNINNNNNMSHDNINQFDETIYQTTTTSDLLTLLHLPRCSTTLLPPPPSSHTPPISFSNSMSSPPPPPPPGLAAFLGDINNPNMNINMNMNLIQDSGLSGSSYDPLFHLNLPPQPSPLLRDLMFHGYPNSNSNAAVTSGVPSSRGYNGNCSSLFAHHPIIDDVANGISGMYQESGGGAGGGGEHIMNQNGVFEFTTSSDFKVKSPKNFVTERQRRINFNDKYKQLSGLIPTPTKNDRASIVLDAIKYINELKRTVGELKLLVEKRRISKDRNKRPKTEQNNPSDNRGSENNINNNVSSHGADGPVVGLLVKPDPDDAFAGQLRSSWLQRKCKDTEVDVRIVDDEVTIKLVQRKKVNCLLSVSRTLDDLQLDLRHVAGGHVGDYYSYLFNSKISEGSSVYASAIANKLIEVVERQYAAASVAVAPTSSF